MDKNKTKREAANEMANDFMAGLFSSEKGLNEFIDWVTDAKTANQQVTILQKIKDMFDSFLKYIKDFFANGKFNKAETAALNMAEDRAEALRQKILKALDQAIANKDASHIASRSGNKKTSEIEKIKELINESKAYAEDKNVEHNKFNYFRYYMAFVKFRNEVFPIYLNVGRAKNDGGYHLYDITHKLKNTADRINGLGRLNGEYRPASGVLLNNSLTPGADKSIDNLSKTAKNL